MQEHDCDGGTAATVAPPETAGEVVDEAAFEVKSVLGNGQQEPEETKEQIKERQQAELGKLEPRIRKKDGTGFLAKATQAQRDRYQYLRDCQHLRDCTRGHEPPESGPPPIEEDDEETITDEQIETDWAEMEELEGKICRKDGKGFLNGATEEQRARYDELCMNMGKVKKAPPPGGTPLPPGTAIGPHCISGKCDKLHIPPPPPLAKPPPAKKKPSFQTQGWDMRKKQSVKNEDWAQRAERPGFRR